MFIHLFELPLQLSAQKTSNYEGFSKVIVEDFLFIIFILDK